MQRGGQCRLWWPSCITSRLPQSDFFLLGWFLPSSSDPNDPIDVVVATTVFPSQLTASQLEKNLHSANGGTTLSLQDHSRFSVLGYCVVNISRVTDQQHENAEVGNGDFTMTVNMETDSADPTWNLPKNATSTSNRDCCKHMAGYLHLFQQISVGKQFSIKLFHDKGGFSDVKLNWVPQLHHIHRNGLLLTCDFHVIIYEQPLYGLHHYSISSWYSKEHVRTPKGSSNIKKPNWVHKLEERNSSPKLDLVMLALNNASAAKSIFSEHVETLNRSRVSHLIKLLAASFWQILSICAASFAVCVYAVLQFFYNALKHRSLSVIETLLKRLFKQSCKNVHMRSCHLLYWPIYLRGSGFRCQACVEYAHRAAVHRHSLWMGIMIDIILGNILGIFLLKNVDMICTWYSQFVQDITNNLLRSGCVWLMGIPAGFKLNTELAEILGMISLNVVQIWSALWFLMKPFLRYFMLGLSVVAILFGVTIAAALCLDMIILVTSHLAILNWLISLLYAQQLQALASLWRIFRGRKWNPLRQRLDSYEYSVEQHVVGSLLFTPLLLLLPTTTVFYIFFTILNSTVAFICIFLEVSILVLHATPYAEIFFWILQPRRFPSGIWFEMLCGSPGKQIQIKPTTVVSVLNTNYVGLGEIVRPHYQKLFLGVSFPFGISFIYNLLSGMRIPSSIHTRMPSPIPWMSIDAKQFWFLVHSSILSLCGRDAKAIDQKRLDRAKTSTKSAVLMNLESRVVVAEDIGCQILTYGERKPVEHFLKAVDAITLKDISTLAEKIISAALTMASWGDVINVPSYDSVSRKFRA